MFLVSIWLQQFTFEALLLTRCIYRHGLNNMSHNFVPTVVAATTATVFPNPSYGIRFSGGMINFLKFGTI
jgi:hypothetical protein